MKKLVLLSSFCFLFFSVLTAVGQSSTNTPDNATASTTGNTYSSVFTREGMINIPWATENKEVKKPTPVVQKKSILKETKEIIESLSSLQFKYAMMLNVNVESLKNVALLGFIDDWFGTRYRYGGTTKKGIDCSALTGSLLAGVYGLSVPRTAREQYKVVEHIKKEDLKEGDLVFFNTKGYVSHVGLYLENGYFLHASTKKGVTISSLDEDYYARTFISGGRIQENKN
ncbi:MAG: C40 family peptidase [Chitinophagaceae bacterium]|nr:C40 family peptidase [Chitinophagaceae bacterium]